MKKLTLLILGLCLAFSAVAQEDTLTVSAAPEKPKIQNPGFYGGMDITSNLMWRGNKWADNPTIVPEIGFGIAGFNVYFCGAYAFDGEYAEFDMGLSYEWRGLKLEVMDYFYPYTNYEERYFGAGDASGDPEYDFFNYRKGETGHQLDVMLSYAPEFFPMHAMWSTLVYGNDYNLDTVINPETGEEEDKYTQAYSSYAEIGGYYEFGDYGMIDLTVGASIFRSDAIYGCSNFAVTNIALTYSKTFEVKSIEFPLFAQVTFNPERRSPYLTFGAGVHF